MFEDLAADDSRERFRHAAIPPMAAFLFAQFYFALVPLVRRVPAAIFWTIDAILLVGVVSGTVMLVRASRRGRSAGWFMVAIAANAVCAWQFLAMTFPWL